MPDGRGRLLGDDHLELHLGRAGGELLPEGIAIQRDEGLVPAQVGVGVARGVQGVADGEPGNPLQPVHHTPGAGVPAGHLGLVILLEEPLQRYHQPDDFLLSDFHPAPELVVRCGVEPGRFDQVPPAR